ncbi:MAG: ABC transporter substrate-binding protein [Lachnospiraceae bacterium]|nr:ABC transporter substrate-binding protein [Lachnospiraceae bacterium]
MKKKILSLTLIMALTASLCACGSGSSAKKDGQTLTVLNYGKYIDESVIKDFEKETGITVHYEEYESPEEMYTKYKAGSIDYDVICSSEYMVEKLINEGEVLEMDYESMDNYKNLDTSILDMAASYDKDHCYSVPYFYGTLGLLYNTNEISPDIVSSWDCLWDPTYEDEIIMENSVRDTFSPALISLGYSINETDESHLKEALALLKKQKDDKIVYGYYVDETADAMIAEEANIALCYSGEAALAMDENENLAYSVPEEGSNLWIDSWFIPKSCSNQKAALQFLNYLCKDDVAQKNFEYVEYASPITSVVENQDAEVLQNEAINPSSDTISRCTLFTALDDEQSAVYTKLWQELLSN